MRGLPLFAPHFTGKLPLPYSLLHGTESEDSHEAAAQDIKTIFESDREKEIFLTISNRYNRRENALDIEHRRQAEEVNRRYYAEFRRDTLRTMYADDVVQKILSQQQALPLQQYRAGLEKAYPMFYLTIGIQMFGLERVGEFLCTFISFMVVLTQPVMQIQYTELYVRNPDDIDTPELKKHYFIRKRGFTFLELLTIPRGIAAEERPASAASAPSAQGAHHARARAGPGRIASGGGTLRRVASGRAGRTGATWAGYVDPTGPGPVPGNMSRTGPDPVRTDRVGPIRIRPARVRPHGRSRAGT